MFFAQKFIIIFLSCHVFSLFGINNKDTKINNKHIINSHVFDQKKEASYTNCITNKHTGIISALVDEKYRKTLWPNNDVDLNNYNTQGKLLYKDSFYNKKTGNTRITEFRQHPVYKERVVCLIKDSSNELITSYPFLHFLHAKDFKKDSDEVYLGTILNNDKKTQDINTSVKDMKKAISKGRKCLYGEKEMCLVDMLNFYGESSLNILVDTKK